MKKITIFFFCLILAILSYGLGCGKKAPPSLPKGELLDRVTELRAERRGGDLYLTGYILGPGPSDRDLSSVTGFRLYYGLYSIKESPCEGCPIEFTGFHEFGPEAIRGRLFSCKVPEQSRAQVSYFKVHLTGKGGVVGPPSSIVRADKR